MCERAWSTPSGAAWPLTTIALACVFVAGGLATAKAASPLQASSQRASDGASVLRDPPTAAEQRVRVDRLARALEDAEAAVRVAGIARTDPAGLQAVRVGSLVLYVDSVNAGTARDAARRAWSVLDAAFGAAGARIADAPLLIRGERSSAAAGDSTAEMVLASSGEPIGMSLSMDRETLRRRLIAHGVGVMRAAMQPDLLRWIGTYEGLGGRGRTFMLAYEELVTSPSTVARECLLGDTAACRSALALGETSDAITLWYGAAQRGRIIESRRWQLRRRAPATYDRCLGGDDAACDAVWAGVDPTVVPPPLGTASRHALVGVATELGGRAAFSRLLDARDGSLADRLSAAAGVPADSLVVEWRRRVLAARPANRSGIPFPRGAAMLGWTVFFGFLATRSTRWR